ncbi:MAG: hypothetical protein WC365_07390 [Candidatus Babeliales bacterium]|jgi:hypothetical protein
MKTNKIDADDLVLILHDDLPKSSGHNKEGRVGMVSYLTNDKDYPYNVRFETVGTTQNYFKASHLKVISKKEYEQECKLFEDFYYHKYRYDEWRKIVLKGTKP